jgi:MFS transporter, DHA1 family, multidrug resistance protein B
VRLFSDLPAAIRLRYLELFLTQLTTIMFLPFMAIYFQRFYDKDTVGLVLILPLLTAMLMAVVGGYLADLRGRKAVVVGCEIAKTVGFVIMATSGNQPLFMLTGFVVVMAGSGASYPAIQAMIVDLVAPEQRKAVYLNEFIIYNLAIASGGIAGAYFFTDHMVAIFTVSALSAASMAALFAIVLDPQGHAEPTTGAQNIASFLSHYVPVFRDKRFLTFLAASLLALGTERFIFNHLSVTLALQPPQTSLLSEFLGAGPIEGIKIYGWLVTAMPLVILAFGKVLPRLFDGILSDNLQLLVGIAVAGVSFGIMAVVGTPEILLLWLIIGTCGELLFWPVRQAWLAGMIPETHRGSYMAANSLVFRGALAIGPTAIFVGEAFGPLAVVIVILAAAAISIRLFLSLLSRAATPMPAAKPEGLP